MNDAGWILINGFFMIVPFLVAMATGAATGLIIGWFTRAPAASLVGGVMGGLMGGGLYYIFYFMFLADWLRRYPRQPNELGMGGYVDSMPQLVMLGLMVGCGIGAGALGSLLGLGLSKNSPKRVRRSLQAALAAVAAGGISYFAYERFLAARIDANELVTFELRENQLTGDRRPAINPVVSLAFSPDETLLASGCLGSASVRLWDVDSKKERGTLIPIQKDASAGAFAQVLFAPDGKALATVRNGKLKLWDVASGKDVAAWDGGRFLAFAPDGSTLAYARVLPDTCLTILGLLASPTGNGPLLVAQCVCVIDIEKGRMPGRVFDRTAGIILWDWRKNTKRAIGTAEDVESVAFSSDGKVMAANDKLEVKLWDVATGKELGTLNGHSPDRRPLNVNARFPRDCVFFLAFTADGKMLATVTRLEAKMWDVSSRQARTTIPLDKETGPIDHAAFTTHGNLLATGSSWGRGHRHPLPGEIKLWDLASGKQIASLSHPADIGSLKFTADGKTLISLVNEERVRLWDVATGRNLATTSNAAKRQTEYSFAVTPDGKKLAVGGEHFFSEPPHQCGNIRVFDLISVNR